MIQPTRLAESDLARISHILPGPDPVVQPGERGIIPVASPSLDGQETAYVRQCLESGWISSLCPMVGRFEEAFAQAVGCRHAIACANGTVALHLVLAALGLQPGDEVILPTFTMIATANAVRYTGARVVLIDATPDTWNLDVEQVEQHITERTRAIIAVHIYGHPAEMAPLRSIADRHGLHLLEDAAQSHGSLYRGVPTGSLADAATFSFYANKIITTGEGGMVTTNNAELARVARRLRDHAFSQERHFWHEYLGFNYRLTGLQAAIGLAQTERLAELVTRRRSNAQRYRERLRHLPGLVLPVELPHVRNVFWMYGMLTTSEFGCSRDELRAKLAARGIETRTFFIPIHLQPIYFQDFRGRRFPVAEQLCQQGLYLPSGATLSEADLDRVTNAIAEIHQEVNRRVAA